jgi:glycosyltransferase 2 family protein
VLGRLRASPWLRGALLAVVLGWCAYGLSAEWPQAHHALSHLHWFPAVGATIAATTGSFCLMLSWRAILDDLGSPLPLPAAIRVMFVAQLGKYVPGAVWAFAAQVELGRDYKVPPRRGATAVMVALVVTLGVALLTTSVTLPIVSAGAAHRYLWALAATPVVLICLFPPVLTRLLDRALVLLRRPALEQRPTVRGLARALGWTSLGWLGWGLQAWLIVHAVPAKSPVSLPLAFGAYALAWAVGVMVVVFPGGIGPRELALIAALAPVMSKGSALVVAVVSRVAMTVSDLVLGGTGMMIGRRRGMAAVASAAALGDAAANSVIPLGTGRSRGGRHRRPGQPSRDPMGSMVAGHRGRRVQAPGLSEAAAEPVAGSPGG